MIRRNFLTGLAGILAAGAAPAVLAQGSAMRIWVPRNASDYVILRRWIPYGHDGSLTFVDERITVAQSRMTEILDPHGSRGWTPLDITPRNVNLNEHWM